MKSLQEYRMKLEKLVEQYFHTGFIVEPERVTTKGIKAWWRHAKRVGFKTEKVKNDPQLYVDRLIPILEELYEEYEKWRKLDRMVLDLDRMTLELVFSEMQMTNVGFIIGDADYIVKVRLPIVEGALASAEIKIKAPRPRKDYYPPDEDYVRETYIEPISKDLDAALARNGLL